jgi:hypothetical protein
LDVERWTFASYLHHSITPLLPAPLLPASSELASAPAFLDIINKNVYRVA